MGVATVAKYVTQGEHHPLACEFFELQRLDAFHHPEVLRVLYGPAWYSVLVTEGPQAFLHVFSPQLLPRTGDAAPGYDVEPFIGYNGPVMNTTNEAFREVALAAYSQLCRELGVIAEVVRFNPVLHNEQAFQGSAQLRVFQAKGIVVAECHADADAQLASFAAKCRSSVRRGVRDCTAEILDKQHWPEFVAFYLASLDRLGAERKWYYSPDIFERAAQSELFQVHLVKHQNQWASLALVINRPLAGYYFVAASSEQPVQGANEFLVFSIAQQLAKEGVKHLILGGGNTASDDDALLRFKRKFAHEPVPLMMGKIAHDAPKLESRVAEAIARRPELAEINFFLKYRLA